MSRKPIPKKIREQVYAKYNGHCAYCGCELEYKDMQVDHISPVYWVEIGRDNPNETIDNYMPSCRACNFYKSIFSIEQFRNNLQYALMRNVRIPFDYRLAVKYGLVVENIKPIKFYFERAMEQTIERDIQIRAAKAYPILTEIAPENDIKNAQFLAYIKGATEQKQIDEAENAKALLYAVNKTAERTKKEMIEKADRWLRTHLPRVISNYPLGNKRTDMLNEDMREEFIKAMEE